MSDRPVMTRCNDCGRVCPEEEIIPLADLRDLHLRLDPGGITPAGKCRECDGLVYYILRCPFCGNHDPNMMHLFEFVERRWLSRFWIDEKGSFHAAAGSDDINWDVNTGPERLFCESCTGDFPVPGGDTEWE